MGIFLCAVFEILLVIFLAFRFKVHFSRFEITRRSKTSEKFRELEKFLEIYPGIVLLTRILALISAIFLTIISANQWGIFGGSVISFAAILLAIFLAHALAKVAQDLIEKNLLFFNHYAAFAKIFAKISLHGDMQKISSKEELIYLIEQSDVVDEETKIMLKNVSEFREIAVNKIMTPREKLKTIENSAVLNPLLLDELFSSGQKIFPIVRKNFDHVEGFLRLDDVLPLNQKPKNLADFSRNFLEIEYNEKLSSALKKMSEENATFLLVKKNSKNIGVIFLEQIRAKLVEQE